MDPVDAAPPTMERRIVSVLFADLVGFTTLSEALDAEDVAAVQDAYFAGVRDAVTRHGGRLEKFIGDAAVAAFGADRTREDDAERAVRAGLAITALVASLGGRLGLDEDVLNVRVGIQTGEVAVATDGPDAGRLTGDTMNTAARFQAAAEPGTVLCGRPTVLAAAHAVTFGDLTGFTLKGKAEPALAAIATGVRPEASRAAAMGELHADLVGRGEELLLLAGAAARVVAGGTERWTVIADPGVGKSRLLTEVRARAEALGAVAWSARLRAGEVAPFAAVAALLRAALGDDLDPGPRLLAAGVDPARASVLVAEASGLLAGSVDGPTGDGDLAAERGRRLTSWLELLDTLAIGRSQLWLVEDVHWAGGDLLAFLTLAGSTPTPAGRLVLATTRPQLTDTAPDWPDHAGGHRLTLAPLAADDAGTLVRALVGAAVPDPLVAAIAIRADGNPLFIEELLRSWVSLGVLVRDGDVWRLTVEPEDVPLPETVQALYAAQLDDLPPAAREVARRASVAGRRFADGLLEEIGLPDGPVRDGLALLLRGSLLDGPRTDPTIGPTYGYRHALLRDAGYASLAKAERVRLHLAVARWLSALPGARETLAEPIGRQLAAAAASMSAIAAISPVPGEDRTSVRTEAAGWLERAAEVALGLAAHDATAALLREAIDLTDPADPLTRSRRQARLGEVLATSGSLAEALDVLAAARDGFRSLIADDPSGAARAGFAAATAMSVRGLLERLRFREGRDLADLALAVLEPDGDPEDPGVLRVRLLRANAVVYETNEPGPAIEVARVVAEIASRIGDAELELEALRVEVAAASEGSGPVDELVRRVATLAEAQGQWPLAARYRYNEAISHLGWDTERMEAGFDAAERLAVVRDLRETQAWICGGRAEAALLSGDWDAVMRHGRASLAIAIPNGYLRAAIRAWFTIRPVAAYRDATALLQELGDWMASLGDMPASPYGRVMQGAIDISVAGARGEAAPLPDGTLMRSTWGLTDDHPSFVAARDAILHAWVDAGRYDDVMAAIAAFPIGDDVSPVAAGATLLWQARFGADEAEIVGLARDALTTLRRWDAAWWIEQAIGILDDAGAATPEEREERRRIRLRLLGDPPG